MMGLGYSTTEVYIFPFLTSPPTNLNKTDVTNYPATKGNTFTNLIQYIAVAAATIDYGKPETFMIITS